MKTNGHPTLRFEMHDRDADRGVAGAVVATIVGRVRFVEERFGALREEARIADQARRPARRYVLHERGRRLKARALVEAHRRRELVGVRSRFGQRGAAFFFQREPVVLDPDGGAPSPIVTTCVCESGGTGTPLERGLRSRRW